MIHTTETDSTEVACLRLEAARNDRVIAQDLFLHGREPEALCYLARALGYAPGCTAAAELAVSMLNDWSYPIPSAVCVGHGDRVISARFSPDGNRIVTGSHDRSAKVWKARTGELLLTLEGHGGELDDAQFSPDGLMIVTTADDHTARVWDAFTGKPLATFPHSGAILTAEINARGSELVTASEGMVRVWSLADGRCLNTLAYPDRWPDACFSPDGRSILTTALEDEVARLWEASTGRLCTELTSEDGPFAHAGFAPDGGRIVTVSRSGAVRLWRLEGGHLATFHHEAAVHSASVSGDGQCVLTASEDGKARVWDAASGKLLATMEHPECVWSAEFGTDSRSVRTVAADWIARVWDSRQGTLQLQVAMIGCDSYGFETPQFSPDGARLVAKSVGNTARVWETSIPRLLRIFPGMPCLARFSPDGRRFGTALGSEVRTRAVEVRIWGVESSELVAVLPLPGEPADDSMCWPRVSFSSDGRRAIAFLTYSTDKVPQIWDVATGRALLALEEHQGAITDGKFSPNGECIATASCDKTARIWAADTGQLLSVLEHQEMVKSVWFSPDGRRLLTCSGEKAIHLWDVSTGKLVEVIAGHTEGLQSIRFSADGGCFITASEDHTVRLWGAEDGRLQITIPMDEAPRLAQFTGNGEGLLVACWDDVEVRDARTGRLLRTLRGGKLPEERQARFSFGPGGTRVAVTGLGRQAVYVWDTDCGHVVAVFLAHEEESGFGAEFSPDGRQLATTWNDSHVRVWELLGAGRPPPPWFADFLRLMSQRRFEADGEMATLSPAEFLALRAELEPLIHTERSRYAAIARWFLSSADERPPRPGSE